MSVETNLVCDLERGLPVSVVRAVGRLSFESAPVLRRAVHKLLADRPDLIVIDVSDLEAQDDLALTALPMLARQAGADGITIIVVGPAAALQEQLKTVGVARRLTIAGSRASALELYARTPTPPRVDLVMRPHPSATTEARLLVDEACRLWRVGYLADSAALVVTELVTNGILHARTPMRLSLSLRARHLHIAVRDGSRRPPRRTIADHDLESGRGLLIIEGLATAWGVVETTDGKVVWALLRRTGTALPTAVDPG